MADLNYIKAWFTFVKPAFENLNSNQKELLRNLIPLVGNLTQQKDLNIPLSKEIEEKFTNISTKEIAELANISYFAGHWQPSNAIALFENKRGESWKISNICDQILKKRLNFPQHKLEIHQGMLRVTFSSKDCWTWEEFALATEENLNIFKNCNLSFTENTLKKNANLLKEVINDLWKIDNLNSLPDSEEYIIYQLMKEI